MSNDILVTPTMRLAMLQKESSRANNTSNNLQQVSSLVFVKLAESGDFDEVTATENMESFLFWKKDVKYTPGKIRRYPENGESEVKLYQCIQEHTSQSDWTPDVAVSLWKLIGDPSVEYPPWSQPLGAHDAYGLDAKVSHVNFKWISRHPHNVWEPGAPNIPETIWEKVVESESPVNPPDPDPQEPDPDPEEPPAIIEYNSNGTEKWGEWVDPAGDNSKLYMKDDGVTVDGVKKVSAYDHNGNPPSVAGWWTDYVV